MNSTVATLTSRSLLGRRRTLVLMLLPRPCSPCVRWPESLPVSTPSSSASSKGRWHPTC